MFALPVYGDCLICSSLVFYFCFCFCLGREFGICRIVDAWELAPKVTYFICSNLPNDVVWYN